MNNKNQNRINKSIEQRRNGWIPYVSFSQYLLRTTHKHFVSSSLMPNSLFLPTLIKKLCQSLVQLAEVIPTSSGRSSYPPSALTRGRLAHFVHLRTYGFSPCSHTSLRHFATLMATFRFPIAGSRQFSLFSFLMTINLLNF